MMIAAVQDPDPVLLLEPVPLYRSMSAEFDTDGVPAEFGEARIVRPGADATLLAYGPIVHESDCSTVTVHTLAWRLL